jgi:hypothetical protein
MPAQALAPKTPLHALFVRRLREEMGARRLNPYAMKEYGAVQRTLADALKIGTDVRLSTIYKAATALGLEAWQLLKERDDVAKAHNVTQFPPLPSIAGRDDTAQSKKAADRKKASR